MDSFSRPAREWFRSAFEGPTDVQRLGWEAISSGKHALLIAPTGSGKTLAAFLWAIDGLARLPLDAAPGVRVLYVSPLKALVYDVERNLRAPLVGIRRFAERLGESVREVSVDVRTGDTPAADRRRQAREPADILVTTPESLFLLLGSRARETLRTVRTVIVDEVHAVAGSKRGAHLALSLERLAELTGGDPQRLGLSATVRPRDEVARFLGGDRPVEIVDASAPPLLDLEITVPVPDMEHVPSAPRPRRKSGPVLANLAGSGDSGPQGGETPPEKGIWSALYPALLERIRAHRSTILFVNSRGLCERLAQRLNDLAGEELARAHHGSISREKRVDIEEGLKRGTLRAIVATSSLELGIDMGGVDLVLLVESPGSVARGLQRVGRAGHSVGEVSVGRIFPKFRGDLLECAVVASRMLKGKIEALDVPRTPLDVLAQQAVAMCADRPRAVDELQRLASRAYPFRDLSRGVLESVLDLLAGRYPSTEFAELRPLLSWDRATDVLSARSGSAVTLRLNAGTIPDRGNYGVYLGPEGPRLGELDEEMVFETRRGDNILLGASTWHVEEITRDRVIVSPAPGEPGRLPFWHGEGPGRPVELGRALGAFVREAGRKPPEGLVAHLLEAAPLSRFGAENLAAYLLDQKERTGTLPTDRDITIERFRDELGDWRVCILTPFGGRVHAPWALALQQVLGERGGFEVQVMYTDDGIVLRFAESEDLPGADLLVPDPEEVEELVTRQLGRSALFAGLFRENAARFLLLPRRRPGGRSPLWAQRLKAQTLLASVERYPSFPAVLETYRQALGDVFDLPALRDLLARIRSREIRVHEVETPSASPFARSLVFAYVASYLYEGDAPLAERKAQALTLDRQLLSELLGHAELRELLDPGALLELEAELQRTAPDRRARDADEVHDLLRRLGDLTQGEVEERSAGDPRQWLARLVQERRAVRVRLGPEERWIAAEDAGLYRDALGVMPPPGLPERFLEPRARPLEDLLLRYARTHGPFTTDEAARRFGLLSGQAEPALRVLEGEGGLLWGEIRPGGSEPEWCEPEVLRRLKRRSLAKFRKEAAPVDAPTLGLFLPAWQGLSGREGGAGLEEALSQLEGLVLPWSELSTVILPRRVRDFRLEGLDMLSASGRVVWVGAGAYGPRDGKVAIFRREQVSRLLEPPSEYGPPTPLHRAILEQLGRAGASFLFELGEAARAAAPGHSPEEFRAALWDLVWEGQVTNDTFGPLRTLSLPSGARGRRLGQPLAGGRWSLVRDLLRAEVSPTERAVARAGMLLARYGLVSRECAAAEGLSGGFGPVYRALRAMQEAGRVRRGYFVEGLSGAQFAQPGAVDRLRGFREEVGEDAPPEVLVLGALDPANPYGSLLPWPTPQSADSGALRRTAGAWVVLAAGRLLLHVSPRGRHVTTFPQPGVREVEWETAFAALARLPHSGARRGILVEEVDGRPVRESPWYELLRRLGFESDYRGLLAPIHPTR